MVHHLNRGKPKNVTFAASPLERIAWLNALLLAIAALLALPQTAWAQEGEIPQEARFGDENILSPWRNSHTGQVFLYPRIYWRDLNQEYTQKTSLRKSFQGRFLYCVGAMQNPLVVQ